MKARTKFQKEVVAQSHNLRPLNKAQKLWALNTAIEHYAYRLPVSHVATCMTCGHQWKLDTNAKACTCPHCKRQLKVEDTKKRIIRERGCFNILTTCGKFQVLRTFYINVKMVKGYAVNPEYLEVSSYWWNDAGKEAVIGKMRSMGGYYVDSFNWASPMTLRTDNDVFRQLADQWLYPDRKTIATLNRNGYYGEIEGVSIHDVVSLLLSSPIAETLIKSGDIRMFRHYSRNKTDVERYWGSYKIAKRAGYFNADTDLSLWFDYVKMLERFGRDIKSPSLICPKSLKAEHDSYVAKVNRQREIERRAAERERAKADQEKFQELKSRFFGLAFTADEFKFKTIDSIDEYYEIGNQLSICIASSKYYIKPSSLILVAYKGKEIAEVVEISLETMKVVQCHGHHNQDTPNHQRIIDLANANTLPIRKRMTA